MISPYIGLDSAYALGRWCVIAFTSNNIMFLRECTSVDQKDLMLHRRSCSWCRYQSDTPHGSAISQLAMRRRATSSQRWHPLPRSRSHTQRRADVGSRSQAAQSATKLCSADLLGSGLSLCWHHRWIVCKAIPARWQKSENCVNLQLLKLK